MKVKLASIGTADERENAVDHPAVFGSLAVAEIELNAGPGAGEKGIGAEGFGPGRTGMRGDRRTKLDREGTHADRRGNVQPAAALPLVGPDEARMAAQIEGVNSPPNHLEPRVPRVDIPVDERDVAGVVAAEKRERLRNAAFGNYAAVGEADAQIQRMGGAARLGELGD